MASDFYDNIDSAILPFLDTGVRSIVSTMFEFWEDAIEFICSEALAGHDPVVKWISPKGAITCKAHWIVETRPTGVSR